MKAIKYLSIFILLLALSALSNAQKCKDYHFKKCYGYGDPFKYSKQSKSTLFEKGQKSDLYISVFKGFEYNITLCAAKKLGYVYFKIKESGPAQRVLYDSSIENDYVLEKQFYSTGTKKLILEISVEESELEPEEEDYENLVGCIGVLIEYQRAPKSGF